MTTDKQTTEASPPGTDRSPRRRRPRRPLEMSAGRAVVLVLVALAVAALLTAESVRTTASRQDEGLARDVGLALTKPLVVVAQALRLDRPRDGMLAALGRETSGDEDVVVTFERPPEQAPAEVETGSGTSEGEPATNGSTGGDAAAPAKEAFSPKRKLRILAAGDSLAITPGWAVYRLADSSKVMRPVAPVDGRVSTGLSRPDVFDWFGHVRDEVDRLRPHALVLLVGANDNHDLLTGAPEAAEIGAFGTRSWVREYRRRVGGIIDDMAARGTFVVWIGLPITRSEIQSERFAVLNRIYRSEARERPGKAAYIDTWSLFQDESGRYAEYLPDKEGTLVKMRTGDGVHFERAGGDRVAWRVVGALRSQFDLTSWKSADG